MKVTIDNRPIFLLFLLRYYKFFLLIAIFSLFIFFLNFEVNNLSKEGYRIILVFLLTAILWSTNLIPTAITSLLVLVLIPALSILPAKKTFSLFGNEPLFFILSAFIISSATEKSGLSKRITLLILSKATRNAKKLAFLIYITGLLMSFFMPEHAVAVFLFPIVMGIAEVLKLEKKKSNFGKLLFISLAYGTIIGGIATFLGGARNALAVGLLEEIWGIKISFIDWLKYSLPVVIPLSIIGFIIIFKIFKPEPIDIEIATKKIKRELETLPPFTFTELIALLIILITICGWILIGHKGIGFAGVSIISAVLFFIFRVIEWQDVEKNINWSAFFMYGGAITLGTVFAQTDAGTFFINKFGIIKTDIIIYALIVGSVAILITEFISNATVVALLLPIILKSGINLDTDLKILTASIALMSGLAFMLPVGTPSHLICYSSGFYSIKDSIKAGFLLNILSLISLFIAVKFIWVRL